MKNFADVSVVIPSYNSEKTILRSLNSVINQTLLPKEIIIIDDKSTDSSLIIIEKFIKNNNLDTMIKLIKLKKNSGPSKARNEGWDNASSKYIAFLDSDDSWHPQKIEIQYKFMHEHKDISLSSHYYEVINVEPQNKELIFNNSFTEISKIKSLIKNHFTTPTVMLNKELNFRFDENKKYSEDYKLWLEIIHNEKKSVKLNICLTYLHKSEFGVSGLSSNIIGMHLSGLANFKYLYKKKYINIYEYIFAVVLRNFKFIRILLKTSLLKWNSK